MSRFVNFKKINKFYCKFYGIECGAWGWVCFNLIQNSLAFFCAFYLVFIQSKSKRSNIHPTLLHFNTSYTLNCSVSYSWWQTFKQNKCTCCGLLESERKSIQHRSPIQEHDFTECIRARRCSAGRWMRGEAKWAKVDGTTYLIFLGQDHWKLGCYQLESLPTLLKTVGSVTTISPLPSCPVVTWDPHPHTAFPTSPPTTQHKCTKHIIINTQISIAIQHWEKRVWMLKFHRLYW